MSAPTTSSWCTNALVVEAEDLGDDRPPQRERERRVEIVAEHVGEAEQGDGHVGAVVGEVAEECLDLEEGALDSLVDGGLERVISSRMK